MVFGVILAGGIGSRMGNVEKPKQYLSVGGKPIILHTLEKFYVNSKFEKLIVLCPSQWINHTKNLVKKNFNDSSKIVVIEGGSTRNETIMNSIRYIEKEYGLDDDTIIVTHDSVRPFLTYRIIEDNIRYAQEYGACDTVIPASDTIVESAGHEIISNIPDRSIMYQGQTPQSFKAKKLKELYEGLTEEEKEEEVKRFQLHTIEISNRNLRRSCMKKIVCTMLCIMLLFGLSACGGDVSEVKTHNVESESYSEEDIKAAIDTIKKEFKSDWKGCTLTEIYYAGDDCTKDHKDWADRNNADEVIVLLSSFDVDSSGGDGSLNPNSTYNDWNWILVRTNGGQWQHVDHGY